MDIINILKEIDIFQELTENELMTISKMIQTKFVKKNTLVFLKGDVNHSMYILKEGNMDVSILTESGRELILSTLSAGDYFGELSLLDGEAISANITTVKDTTLLTLHKDHFFQVMKANSKLMANVISQLCIKIRELTVKVEGFALLDVYQRFTLLLMDLSSLDEAGQRVVTRPLTHKDIALRVGASREMVSRIIKDLDNGGYISIEKKVITIRRKLPPAW